MRIGAPKKQPGEARVALTPESAQRLQKLGYDCLVETGRRGGVNHRRSV